jgi:hypothetical protein
VIAAAWLGDSITVVDTRRTGSTTFHRDIFGENFGGRQANSTFGHRADWSPNCTICEAVAWIR